MAEAGFESSDVYMYFLPPGNIKGEALATGDPQGKEPEVSLRGKFAFQVKEFGLEALNEAGIGREGGGEQGTGAGQVKFEAIQITKWVDRATPGLLEAVGSGKQIPTGVIQFRRNGRVYMQIFLTVCTIQKVGIKANEDEEAEEEVTIDYGAMRVEYSRQNEAGNMELLSVARWSRVLNEASEEVTAPAPGRR